MKPPPERQDLLKDILSPEGSQDDRFLQLTLQAVRTRRRVQRGQRIALALALILIPVSLQLRFSPSHPSSPAATTQVAKTHTTPKEVTTSPLDASRTVVTRPSSTAVFHSRSLANDRILATQKSTSLQYINDEQLLLLAQNQRGVLVRQDGSPARLLFPEPMESH